MLHQRRIGWVGLQTPADHTQMRLVLHREGLALLKGVEAIQPQPTRLGLVSGDGLRLGLDRDVHGIGPQVEEERSAIAMADQVDGAIR